MNQTKILYKTIRRVADVAGILFLLACVLVAASGCSLIQSIANDEEEVTFYATYGYQSGENWVIPMRLYVHEENTSAENRVIRLTRSMMELEPEEVDTLRSRIREFAADSESRESVLFVFDDDPDGEEYRLQDENGNFPQTTLNGIKEGFIRMPFDKADLLLRNQDSENSWLRFQAVSDEHHGIGYVQLIGPEGLSVISDIDDTIRHTEINGGSETVMRTTFLEPYRSIPGMAEWYREWQGQQDPAFHYVSGAPWQLYRPLSEFLIRQEEFPAGSFHMKNVPKNLFTLTTWRDLVQLTRNDNVTYDQKMGQITAIAEHFPDRQFVLIGDSGESDPELYRAIRERYPDRILKIIIRDTIGEMENDPERLAGLAVLPADTGSCPGGLSDCFLQEYDPVAW